MPNKKAKQRKMDRKRKNLEIRQYKRMKKKLRKQNGTK
tara:strand:- start:278 stop:391 length:114 start_codon:yes stop_codon:yes gene_type:complete